MIKAQRDCQIQGHQGLSTTHICTFQGCNQDSRWACPECFAQLTHKHNQQSQTHLMNQKQFIMIISQMDNQKNNDFQVEIQQYIQSLTKLIQVISQLEILLQTFQKDFDDYMNSLSQQLVENDFYSLNNDQINQILNKQGKNQLEANNQLLLSSVQQITRQSQEIESSILQKIQAKQSTELIQSYYFKDYAKLNQNYTIFTAQISQNEQYLAYGGYEQLLVIYDINQNKEMKTISLDYKVYFCRFSNDSKLLYVGCWEGYLYCIDIAHNYKQIYHQQINKDNICNLIEQSKKIIISSHKTCIIVTNIKLQQQILKIDNAHINWIYGLDYQKSNDVLVSGSQDKSIKFFKLESGLHFIEKQLAHNNWIYKIQLIKNNNQLLSLSSDKVLKNWQVDYYNRNLLLLNQITDQNGICNFNYVNQYQIIIICKNYCKILDEESKVIKHIDHSQNDDVEYNETNQLESMNYIILCGHKNFTVMKREEKEQ